MILKGKVWKMGDHINTDAILPSQYLNISNPNELGAHCFEGYSKDFVKNINLGDMVLAGDNFGCGSSREHAPISIRASGISCVIAKSFARIFYRNAINIGLPIFESADAYENILQGDEIEIYSEKGIIKNLTQNKLLTFEAMPVFIQDIIFSGGLIGYTKNKIREGKLWCEKS